MKNFIKTLNEFINENTQSSDKLNMFDVSDDFENNNIDEHLPEYEDWADINKPIDMNKKPLKVGDYVKMDDLSPFRMTIENKWKILSFDTGTSAGVEAKIEHVKDKARRSEPVRYLIKSR